MRSILANVGYLRLNSSNELAKARYCLCMMVCYI
jgi:hypothetical protein